MKKLTLIAAAMLLCTIASAQIMLGGSSARNKNTKHSNTVIIKNKVDDSGKGWHGMAEFGVGPSFCDGPWVSFQLTGTGVYQFANGFTTGASIGFMQWSEHEHFRNAYIDARLLADVGYTYTRGQGSIYALVAPGLEFVMNDVWCCFTADIKIGYRHMYSSNLGICFGIGATILSEGFISVPLSVGIVF